MVKADLKWIRAKVEEEGPYQILQVKKKSLHILAVTSLQTTAAFATISPLCNWADRDTFAIMGQKRGRKGTVAKRKDGKEKGAKEARRKKDREWGEETLRRGWNWRKIKERLFMKKFNTIKGKLLI